MRARARTMGRAGERSSASSFGSSDAIPRAFDPRGLDEVFTFWTPVAPQTVFAGVTELAPGVDHPRVKVLDGLADLPFGIQGVQLVVEPGVLGPQQDGLGAEPGEVFALDQALDPPVGVILLPQSGDGLAGILQVVELPARDGIPDQATADKLYDQLDLQRGISAFLNGLRGVSIYAARQGIREAGVKDNEGVLIFSGLMDAQSLFLTANADTVYFIANIDLTKGPMVIETMHEGALVGWSWLVPPHVTSFDARATSELHAIAFDGLCLRGKADADPELGYAQLKLFAPVIVEAA